jgi:hypothetical protein
MVQIIQSNAAKPYSARIVTYGEFTYIALAPPGTAYTDAKWQVRKVDNSSGTDISWADGDENFDNQADDLTNLTYL